jgi:hypothetical protein
VKVANYLRVLKKWTGTANSGSSANSRAGRSFRNVQRRSVGSQVRLHFFADVQDCHYIEGMEQTKRFGFFIRWWLSTVLKTAAKDSVIRRLPLRIAHKTM